jgi:DNA-directed RNA polymerase specialized sigma24 family protein
MQDHLSEAQLRALRRGGDGVPHAGLGHLFKQYRHLLVGFAMRYTGCRDEAEDVVQAAFVQALARASGSRPQRTVPTALFGSALLLARERMRQPLPPQDDAPGAPPDPFELIALHQLKSALTASLHAFPQPLLETFDLVVNGDTCHDEAADYLGIERATVQAYMAHVGELVRRLMPAQGLGG